MPYAIGASFAQPNRPILLVTGDGGWMLGGLSEFNTAVRYGVDLTVVVCNDSSYGAEYIQFTRKDMDPALSLFRWPDFAPVAIALGGHGFTIRTNADLPVLTDAVATSGRPLLIDLKIDPAA
jgi:thiamine pyrophosphate-dependent acetolactate synthase large subunit-like protein